MDTQKQKSTSNISPQIDEALSDIRKAIVAEKDAVSDVLELTEIIEGEGEGASNDLSDDILKKIDNNANVKKARTSSPASNREGDMPDNLESIITNTNESFEAPVKSKQEGSNSVNDKAFIAEEVAQKSQDLLKSFIQATSKNQGSGDLQFRAGNTLEDLVVELLRPQLSEWLNNNLPRMVQTIVEKEIKKLIPRDE